MSFNAGAERPNDESSAVLCFCWQELDCMLSLDPGGKLSAFIRDADDRDRGPMGKSVREGIVGEVVELP